MWMRWLELVEESRERSSYPSLDSPVTAAWQDLFQPALCATKDCGEGIGAQPFMSSSNQDSKLHGSHFQASRVKVICISTTIAKLTVFNVNCWLFGSSSFRHSENVISELGNPILLPRRVGHLSYGSSAALCASFQLPCRRPLPAQLECVAYPGTTECVLGSKNWRLRNAINTTRWHLGGCACSPMPPHRMFASTAPILPNLGYVEKVPGFPHC
jgi:hypothetical protein